MDQLFINERELPLPPRASVQQPQVLPVSEGDIEPLSVQQGKAPEQSQQPVPTRSSEEQAYPLQFGSDGIQNETEALTEEGRISWEQYMPGYAAEREMQLAFNKRLNAAEQQQNSEAISGEGSSRLHAPLRGTTSSNSGDPLNNLDIYSSNGEEESIYRAPPPALGPPAEVSTGNNGRTVPRRYSRPSRPYSGYPGGAGREGSSPGVDSSRQTGTLPSQVFQGSSPQTDVVVPRWQPDAEVTFCPICRTQFSFFVRKHHCRKCGRVVCNSCSPHRITIPHQYIVQPPVDQTTSTNRPAVDPARARSSTVVASLGGGERVRLCNPCVPDPNIAPPQTRSDGQPLQSQGHTRSASTVTYTQSRRGDLDIPNFRQRPRESSISTEARHHRNLAWAAGHQGNQQQHISSSYSQRDESLLRPEGLEARSRSSTVGSSREGGHSSTGQESSRTYSRPYNPLVPRSEVNLSRPLPDTPHQQRRRQIREEDQCWVCYQELPSRDLPDFQDLRDAHVIACLDNATRRSSPAPRSTPPAPPPPAPRSTFNNPNIDPRLLQTSGNGSGSGSSTPSAQPALSTPESRMLARERQHAAIVYGQSSNPSSSSSSSPMSRVIPYLASEKDGIDDAECMVCLEDFEVGQEMGRLECFCRFHLKCIKGWFEKKPGKCPVHGVDG